MKTSGMQVCALFAGCVAIVACSQTTELSRLQYTPNDTSLRPAGASQGYRVLHTFGADRDGADPNGLIRVGDTFYGTTAGGGTNSCPYYYGGCGTVFSITMDGKEQVLHDFGDKKDGRNPAARLIYGGGMLYGTTALGGTHGDGTVFSITPDGKEKVLYSFGARPDGESPSAELIDMRGTLFGTTFAGGTGCAAEGCGTVFSITTDGKETVLHRFGDEEYDGWYPAAGLTDVGGTLYGTTFGGGKSNYGTVFRITTGGSEKVLHSLGEDDGQWPSAGLLDVNGTLYGTTQGGGKNCASDGCGTVFSITIGGSEKVLHNFSGTDGAYPQGSLVDVGGRLYGTTEGGGTNDCPPDYFGRCGTVFSVPVGSKEKVLHDFQKGTGGNGPQAALTYKSGRFFGTTARGGRYGGGVVFSLTP